MQHSIFSGAATTTVHALHPSSDHAHSRCESANTLYTVPATRFTYVTSDTPLSSFRSSMGATSVLCVYLFFFNDTATTEIYTLSLHDALPIWARSTAWVR